MSINRITRMPSMLCRLASAGILLLNGACAIQKTPTNQYQSDIDSSQVEARPVAELHNQALTAMGNSQFQLAIDTLQRAIKIQPRNAWSWHYLAQGYWHAGQNDQCLEMIERSFSYASYDDVLELANDELKTQCQQG